jgi:hypothetical protein
VVDRRSMMIALLSIYQRDIVDAGKEPEFLILISFLAAFAAVRLITHAIRSGRVRALRDVDARGTHVHHLVWGILLLLVSGFLAVTLAPGDHRSALAVAFGVGAALTLDEFALWLHLEDVYWSREGRTSVDAVVIAATLVAILLVGGHFWIHLGEAAAGLVPGA